MERQRRVMLQLATHRRESGTESWGATRELGEGEGGDVWAGRMPSARLRAQSHGEREPPREEQRWSEGAAERRELGESWGEPLGPGGVWGCLEMGGQELGQGESWDQNRIAGRSCGGKRRVKALYPLGQWFSAFLKGMVKGKGNSSSVVGEKYIKMVFRM